MSIDKDFEDFFRDRLEGLEETPPANGWEKIREDIKPWYRKINWTAVAALLLLLPALVFFALKFSDRPEEATAVKADREIAPVIAGNEATESGTITIAGPVARVNPETATSENATAKTNPASPKNTSADLPESSFSAENPTVSPNAGQRPVQKVAPVVAAINRSPEAAKEKQPEIAASEKAGKVAVTRKSRKAVVGSLAVAGTLTKTRKPVPMETGKAAKTSPETAEASVSRQTASQNQTAQPTKPETVANITGFTPNAEIALLALKTPENAALVLPQNLPLLPATKTPETTNAPALALWSLSGFVSPRSTFSQYSANRNDGKLIREMSKNTSTLSDVLSYETGLTLHRAVSDRFSVDAGVIYSALKDEVHYLITTGEVKSKDLKNVKAQSAEVSINYNFYHESLKTRFSYTGLKLGTTYTLAQREKTRFYLSGGGTFQYLVSSRTEVYRNEQLVSTSLTNLSDNPMQKLNGQLYGNFGFSRNFDHNWHIFAEPGFGYFLGSAFRNSEVLQLKPVTFGFNFGFRHDL